jgi:hypothetical protein
LRTRCSTNVVKGFAFFARHYPVFEPAPFLYIIMPSNSVLHTNLPPERSLSRRSAAETEIDVAGFPAHTRRMAKKAAAKGRADLPVSHDAQQHVLIVIGNALWLLGWHQTD